MQLPLKDPLAFPAGFTPGFNPNHIALKGNAVCLVSAIPTKGNYISLLNGQAGTASTPPTYRINSSMGPVCDYSGSLNTVVTFTGASRTLEPTATFGGFCNTTNVTSPFVLF